LFEKKEEANKWLYYEHQACFAWVNLIHPANAKC